jgi:quercetin dioxygenase-like cupin family protein
MFAKEANATIVTPDQVAWRDNPLIPKAQAAILVGDPTKAAVVVMRVKLPPNSRHPPHSHP